MDVIDAIADNRSLFNVELDDIAADELGVVRGSAMLKDETNCIRCGLCAMRCPASTITMEAYHFRPAEATGLISIQTMDLSTAALTRAAKR